MFFTDKMGFTIKKEFSYRHSETYRLEAKLLKKTVHQPLIIRPLGDRCSGPRSGLCPLRRELSVCGGGGGGLSPVGTKGYTCTINHALFVNIHCLEVYLTIYTEYKE